MVRSVVAGSGSYLPEKILTNDDISKIVDTNDEWIFARTGIKQRHIAAEGEQTSDMAFFAAQNALKSAGLNADDIDLVIIATTTPDNTFPSTATKVQHMLSMVHGAAFDIQAVCTGFIYALSTADMYLKSGQYNRVLVIGADKLSNLLDWEDRGTCILFGDGAGALILEAQNDTKRGILSSHLHSDGSTRDLLYVDGGAGSSENIGKLRMEGREVFKHAVQKMADCTLEALEYNNLTTEDVDWLVPHQANMRIMDSVAKRLKFPKEKVMVKVAEHANTSAATIPLAIDAHANHLNNNDLLALQALGGGLTWGSCLIRW